MSSNEKLKKKLKLVENRHLEPRQGIPRKRGRRSMLKTDAKYIYISLPKCASTSMANAIGEERDMSYMGKSMFKTGPANFGMSKNGSFHLCQDFKQYLKQYLDRNWDDYVKFIIARNPWDRAISSWKFIIKRKRFNLSFMEFLNEIEQKRKENICNDFFGWHTCNLFDNIVDNNGDIIVDHILKFENLQNDFDNLLDKFGKSHIQLSFLNKTSHLNYTEYYDSETIDKVYDIYKKDVDFFGYKFE
jgi:hypothetical protein